MKTVTLGGDRLGSGNKQKVTMHGFERSNHDLGYVWRNTQAPGTLVPFMTKLALPGDEFDINLAADVKTHPTLGPLFASFKLQLDVFSCPIRLYHSWLHNNKLNIGNNMATVKLPQLKFENMNNVFMGEPTYILDINNQQINQSCIFSYLGLRGIGQTSPDANEPQIIYKNGLPFLMYWDIYKNYYANKQEEVGYVIHNADELLAINEVNLKVNSVDVYTGNPYNIGIVVPTTELLTIDCLYMVMHNGDAIPAVGTTSLSIWLRDEDTIFVKEQMNLTGADITAVTYVDEGLGYGLYQITAELTRQKEYTLLGIGSIQPEVISTSVQKVKLVEFPLNQIDEMREAILTHDNSSPFIVNESLELYALPFEEFKHPQSLFNKSTCSFQEGLAIKTYQSDIFNNWLNTEWLDGVGGINEITAVSTSEGSFDINTLNLAQKVYDMLNRIAVSGGTYEDWLEAVYDHEVYNRTETPVYCGGLSKEIIFQEVISNASAVSENEGTQPLGTLAGRGLLASKHKGGHVTIKVHEPSYIIGIVSITPRIDYFQGNDFFVNHTTMDDLHKPSLDQIGFQDLITDKIAFWDTTYTGSSPNFRSTGKQPAWIDYMTDFNRLHGNFANVDNEMFMTLARRYEADYDNNNIKDLTSYIDPTKFNYAFAQTELSAMNFWVQIGTDITARRKISAKLMPNL